MTSFHLIETALLFNLILQERWIIYDANYITDPQSWPLSVMHLRSKIIVVYTLWECCESLHASPRDSCGQRHKRGSDFSGIPWGNFFNLDINRLEDDATRIRRSKVEVSLTYWSSYCFTHVWESEIIIDEIRNVNFSSQIFYFLCLWNFFWPLFKSITREQQGTATAFPSEQEMFY